MAAERRHEALASTAGLNQDVFDSLVILASHTWEPTSIATGWAAVQDRLHQLHPRREPWNRPYFMEQWIRDEVATVAGAPGRSM